MPLLFDHNGVPRHPDETDYLMLAPDQQTWAIFYDTALYYHYLKQNGIRVTMEQRLHLWGLKLKLDIEVSGICSEAGCNLIDTLCQQYDIKDSQNLLRYHEQVTGPSELTVLVNEELTQ